MIWRLLNSGSLVNQQHIIYHPSFTFELNRLFYIFRLLNSKVEQTVSSSPFFKTIMLIFLIYIFTNSNAFPLILKIQRLYLTTIFLIYYNIREMVQLPTRIPKCLGNEIDVPNLFSTSNPSPYSVKLFLLCVPSIPFLILVMSFSCKKSSSLGMEKFLAYWCFNLVELWVQLPLH